MSGTVGTSSLESSEGVQMEYIALFLAVLFPGVLVAFNNELLQALPRQAALRVYCAGIWHNAVCCAVSGLVLFLLPFVLYPLYRYGESPMVLDVSSTSPLSGYLSRGDVILSLDGTHIHNAQDWIDILALMDERALQYSNASEDYEHFMKIKSQKGYCVPRYLMEQNNKIYDSQSACPGELPPFTMVSCFGSRVLDDGSNEDDQYERKESRYCLTAKDIIKLKKCGDGWVGVVYNGSSCICPQDESCLTPIQMLGMSWVEITYSSSYSGDCLRLGRVSFSSSGSDENREKKCGGTFIFVGDVSSLAHSVRLTAYAPRWTFSFGANIPNMLERILICTFYVSLGLAFLNSLLVKFLDGESILEVTLNFLPLSLVSQRKKETVLQLCLLAGTLISILGFLRIFLINIL